MGMQNTLMYEAIAKLQQMCLGDGRYLFALADRGCNTGNGSGMDIDSSPLPWAQLNPPPVLGTGGHRAGLITFANVGGSATFEWVL